MRESDPILFESDVIQRGYRGCVFLIQGYGRLGKRVVWVDWVLEGGVIGNSYRTSVVFAALGLTVQATVASIPGNGEC